MISLNIEKLFEFISPEGSCECCGISCKTAFCDSCREDLNEALDNNDELTEEEKPLIN
ncbi:MAG: hypothetical protein ACRBBR_15925 [Cellvibrionaceae bacterium]